MGFVEAQQRHRDAVEALGGQRVQHLDPLARARQIQACAAQARERARNDHGKHDAACLIDAGIPGRIAVVAARLQLVAEFCFLQ